MARRQDRRGKTGNQSPARRNALRKILACAVVAATPGALAENKRRFSLPLARNLAADAAAAAKAHTPILLFFDRDDCPYCERALREYLVPMSGEDPWRAKAIFRQIEVDQDLPLTDFAGAPTTHRALAMHYRTSLTPTIILVDAGGKPLGEPLIGLMTPDFYASYIGDAIDAAMKRM